MGDLWIVHAIATAAVRVIDALVLCGVTRVTQDAAEIAAGTEGRAAPTARAICVDLTARRGTPITRSFGTAAHTRGPGHAIRVSEAFVVAAERANTTPVAATVGA